MIDWHTNTWVSKWFCICSITINFIIKWTKNTIIKYTIIPIDIWVWWSKIVWIFWVKCCTINRGIRNITIVYNSITNRIFNSTYITTTKCSFIEFRIVKKTIFKFTIFPITFIKFTTSKSTILPRKSIIWCWFWGFWEFCWRSLCYENN